MGEESDDEAGLPHAFFIDRKGTQKPLPLASIEAVLFVETMICEFPMSNLIQHTDELPLTWRVLCSVKLRRFNGGAYPLGPQGMAVER